MKLRYGYWAMVIVLAGAVLMSGCAQSVPEPTPMPSPEPMPTPMPSPEPMPTPQPSPEPSPAGAGDWMDIELTDVTTGETFKISDFKGQPILLESFAVWCPTCSEQQRQIKKIRETGDDDTVHISLDTDPNEDEDRVREHVEFNRFDWYYAVSPIELTRALIDEFGVVVVNAPRAPVILICEDQSARLLEKGGVKNADELLAEIERGCP